LCALKYRHQSYCTIQTHTEFQKEHLMRNGHAARLIVVGILLSLAACNKTGTSGSSTTSTTTSNPTGATNSGVTSPNASSTSGGAAANQGSTSSADATTSAPAPPPVVIEAGKTLAVTIDQNLNTKDNASGDHFAASLAAPLMVNGTEIAPKGTHVRGTITESAEAGHVRGGATLAITLSSITINSQDYPIKTTSYTQTGKTRGKRTGIGAGGGAAFGAIVGALAGGGKGAAIGAAAGGGAGTAGAAYTGDRDTAIPAETLVHLKLTRSVTLSQ
jgi:hypothetical protein